MGDLVNLNRIRKTRARAERAAVAATNRVAFGRDAAQRADDARETQRRAALLDGVRRKPEAQP